MVVKNVTRQSKNASTPGAFADVYQGRYDDDDVAIKHLRALHASTEPIERVKKVRPSPTPPHEKHHLLYLHSYYTERLSCGSVWIIKTS